jgi:hypothetical protein
LRGSAAGLVLQAIGGGRPGQDLPQGLGIAVGQGATDGERGQVHSRLERRDLLDRAVIAHEAAAAAVGVDQPEAARLRIRAGDRAEIDPERLGEVALRRQAIAGAQGSAVDIPAQRRADRQVLRAGGKAEVRQPHAVCQSVLTLYPYKHHMQPAPDPQARSRR